MSRQALQKAGLCGPHSSTRLLVLGPRTLGDALDSILEVRPLLLALPLPAGSFHITCGVANSTCRSWLITLFTLCTCLPPLAGWLQESGDGALREWVQCGTFQIGAAANAAAEAVRLVDKLRARLRAGAAEVAGAQSRPRVMVLESLQPLRIGDAPTWAVTTDVLADPHEIA